jgi:hypothetical protein
MNVTGIKIVFGIPKEIRPLANAPAGRRRFKFRNHSAGMVVIKEPCGARGYVLTDLGDRWGLLAQGRNLRTEGPAKFTEGNKGNEG